MHKKGDVSMNYIIIAAIALVALVVIVLFFTGGLNTLFKQQKETVEGATNQQLEIWRGQCKLYCSLKQKESFCNHIFEGQKDKDGKITIIYGCNSAKFIGDLTKYGMGIEDLRVDCLEITSCS